MYIQDWGMYMYLGSICVHGYRYRTHIYFYILYMKLKCTSTVCHVKAASYTQICIWRECVLYRCAHTYIYIITCICTTQSPPWGYRYNKVFINNNITGIYKYFFKIFKNKLCNSLAQLNAPTTSFKLGGEHTNNIHTECAHHWKQSRQQCWIGSHAKNFMWKFCSFV